jgi:hypothetical protein
MNGLVEVTAQRPLPKSAYSASEITLYGVPLVGGPINMGDILRAWFTVGISNVGPSPKNYGPALIYGYAYQGHCYSMPEPVIVAVDRTPGAELPASGCGYGGNFLMWTVDQKELSIHLQITNDSYENLILKKNLPGPKQPGSYNAMMTIGHRGGRLVD